MIFSSVQLPVLQGKINFKNSKMALINFDGLIFGVIAFLLIGVFHPVVIKVEYHFGKRTWPLFALLGIVFCAISILFTNNYISVVLGVLGFSLFWSAYEIVKQHDRVLKGRAKRNPKRDYD